ncbi:helix-turn-helix transcriptional regulator [Geomicrobium sp. JCM 19039]|uniref:helix-turn-helix transcriptional regulator n=1 Tax=Geomicrobium sp. JCM 19039 TaxID=1460636 RepID=UPI00045F1988|nr:helix-turn-helix transcriptional regulator [Geomicrobium sp. JCM 19039]GAK12999.1 transcriptional regulator, Cro/CI family [Geomicrobium sp. JCM 19039]
MENRMKELRKAQGLSQEGAANLLGVSRQTIISIEKGVYNPSLPLAFQIAKLFDKKIEEVFLFEE